MPYAMRATARSGRARSRRYNGVAILARGAEPVEIRRGLPGDPGDEHARYSRRPSTALSIGCLYAPNGNPQPGPKFDFKLAWLERLIAHAAALYAQRRTGRAGRRL